MEELVLDCVIPYIQDNNDLNSISLVSKKYLDNDSLTRKHLTVHVHFAPDPKRVSHRFPNLESLTLKSYSYGRDTVLKCSISVFPWILEIAVNFKSLKSLSIRNMVVSPFDLKLLAKTRGANLRSLEIRHCDMYSAEGLIDIASDCKELRNLRLENNDMVPDYKWLHELALCNTVMESLDLKFVESGCWYDIEDVTLLANKCSKSLVSLIISGYLNEFGEVFDHAKKLNHFGNGLISCEWDYRDFKLPPNIRGLRIHDLREEQFSFLLPYLSQLRELNLYCEYIEENCQCFLFERCPGLEVLETDDKCGDIGLQVIGQFCKNLRKFTHYRVVTQMGLIALAQGCPHLEYLRVVLSDISNEAFECVGAHLKNLRDFRNCRVKGLTLSPLDNGVRAMLMGCSRLERLDITLCFGELTDVGLGYIGEYGHNLRRLSLAYTGISDAGLQSDAGLLELLKGCSKLRKLNLTGCPFSEAIASFVFNINHSIKYIRVKRDYRDDGLVHARPMVSAEIQKGESRKRKASEAEHSRSDDLSEDNLQEVTCSSRSADHTQEVKEEYEGGVESNVCCNEEEVQADIFTAEGSGKHHEDKRGSGRSQCADKSTSITDESFQDVTREVLTEAHVTLAEKLHALAVQLVADGSGVESVKITYTSSRAADDLITPLVRNLVAKDIWNEERLVLDGSSEKPLEIIVRIAEVESRFATAVSEFGEIQLHGRVKDGVPHLTKVGASEVDVSLEGNVLLCRQVDQANTFSCVASISSILGEENVNMNYMTVARLTPRKQAVVVIGIDVKPSEEALKKIDEIPAVEEFVFLAL